MIEAPPRPRSQWLRPRSIRARLSLVFALLFLVVIGLGIFGIQRLGDVNSVSDEIRNHWLQDARILGDLSNYMSDYRAAEATHLLSSTPIEVTASETELTALDATVARHQRAYGAITQEPAEAELYRKFAQEWSAYLAIASNVLELARSGHRSEGIVMYMTTSRRAFDLASDTLVSLTDQTVEKARAASERAATTYEHSRRLIVIAMLLAGSLLIGGIVYVTRSILNPMLDLARRMRALASQDTEIAIPGSDRADEMGEMARSMAVFRDNAVALMKSQQRLLEQAATLDEALENEHRLTVKQRNFVSMTSHEFRTPLTIIDAHAQRLIKMSERLDPPSIAERAGRIRSAVVRMTSIIDSLLAASRVLDGEGVFNPTNADPVLLLREACQVHREATRGANITEDFGNLPASIPGDPKLLFHAFSNLISNAIKYSAPGSPIEIIARQEADDLVVRVCDHGIGIPARDRKRLFERYFRSGNATGIAGTGVGLHLVAMVIKLHHGEVFAESLEGVGSTFILRLPVRS
ncbi:MAG: ATP-binding protein [Steroidobacterales bacterium]